MIFTTRISIICSQSAATQTQKWGILMDLKLNFLPQSPKWPKNGGGKGTKLSVSRWQFEILSLGGEAWEKLPCQSPPLQEMKLDISALYIF